MDNKLNEIRRKISFLRSGGLGIQVDMLAEKIRDRGLQKFGELIIEEFWPKVLDNAII